ncbi:type VII toxin-antitoxin system HepT family RNase toxin [Natrialbaceae archaeon A-arb3/5]
MNRVLDAVETIETSLGILADKRDVVDRETYRTSTEIQDVVERRFVKMTEATLDIGTTLVIDERGEPPSSNPATMRQLGALGIVSADVADTMAEAARFRNVLAHTYGNAIEHDVVYDALSDLERYRTFVVEIRDYLDDIGALDD